MKTLSILIPNGTSPKNIGDLAMLTILKNLVNKAIPQAKITIHSTEPKLHKSLGPNVKETLYSYTVFANPKPYVRLARLTRLAFYYLIYKHNLDFLIVYPLNKDILFRLCQDYKRSDLIVFVGGGYLRSKPGITQSLNLLMQLFMISFAKITSRPVIIAPISFGPFAYSWQEKLSSSVLNGTKLIAARETISYQKMRNRGIKNTILSIDHALLLEKIPNNKPHSRIVGFTLRQWLSKPEQTIFEQETAKALSLFAIKHNYSIQPILQVDAPQYGEDDRSVINRVIHLLKTNRVNVKPMVKVGGILSAQKIYSSLDFLVGMRMHANILAATQYTPYIGISYEYKTEGISKLLNLDSFCLKVNEVDSEKLSVLLEKQHRQLSSIRQKIQKKLVLLHHNEKPKWLNILKSSLQ